MARGKRLPQELIQDVEVLFPIGKISPTAAQIEFYRQAIEERGSFYFAVDRQSDARELKREDHTGMTRRVEAILSMGDTLARAWAPRPVWIEDRQSGQLPFVFDRHFWFLDGEHKNATGYAANPNARPEFWRAYQLTIGLAEHGCAPTALIVGESTRLFRDPQWLGLFCRSLWSIGVRVIFGNIGEVTEDNLPMVQGMNQALSKWLPEAKRGAKQARRQNGQVFHGQSNMPFGLLLELDKTSPAYRKKVYAHPDEWPLLRGVVYGLADGSIASLPDACQWLHDRHGLNRSYSWLEKLLKDSPILTGVYICDRMRNVPRKLRQIPFEDLDITENGYRRYKTFPKEDPLCIPIDFERFDQDPIPPEVLQQARAAIAGRGRPRSKQRPAGCFLSGYHMRCAVCGSALKEIPPRTKGSNWGLACQCVDTVRMGKQYRPEEGKPLTWAEASAHPKCQHVRHMTMHRPFPAIVWDALIAEFEKRQLNLDILDSGPDEIETERRLKEQIDDLDQQLANLALNMLTKMTPAMRDHVMALQEQVSGQLQERQQELQMLSHSMIEHRMQTQAAQEFAIILAEVKQDATDAQKARLADRMHLRIDVHLEERWFSFQATACLSMLDDMARPLDAGASISEIRRASSRGQNFNINVRAYLDSQGLDKAA